MALELKPKCEKCGRDTPAAAHDVVICSFECTFCASCGRAMHFSCPNCGGELLPRPRRGKNLPPRGVRKSTSPA